RAEAPLNRVADAGAVLGFSVLGELASDPKPANLSPGVAIQFKGGSGSIITIDQAAAKAVLARVGEAFPQPLRWRELLDSAARSDAEAEGMVGVLTPPYGVGMVASQCAPPRFAATAGPRPRVSPLALAQLEAGYDLLTSLRPSVVRLENPITRELVRLLDGTRDRNALLADLAGRAAADPRFTAPGDPRQPAESWRDRLGPQLGGGARTAAGPALLVGGGSPSFCPPGQKGPAAGGALPCPRTLGAPVGNAPR